MAEFTANDDCADAAAGEVLTGRGSPCRRALGPNRRAFAPRLACFRLPPRCGFGAGLHSRRRRFAPRPIFRRSPAASSIRPTSFRRRRAAASKPKLADLEDKSGIQLVVATVNSLQGEEIEPYANELFRTWKLGEKTKNNGVLLLVAPNEHRVRIEVGYGLEGTLTDALSKIIITNAIAPRFKAGDFGGGIRAASTTSSPC